MKTKPIFIGVGGSIGNSVAIFAAAKNWLNQNGAEVLQVSSIHQSQPLGGVAQNIFSNAVWRIETDLGLEKLFSLLKECEIAHGRNLNAPRWSDRELDLDILMFGTESARTITSEQQEIIIPHQSIAVRDFVLKPWIEIVDENFEIPLLGSIKNLLEDLK